MEGELDGSKTLASAAEHRPPNALDVSRRAAEHRPPNALDVSRRAAEWLDTEYARGRVRSVDDGRVLRERRRHSLTGHFVD